MSSVLKAPCSTAWPWNSGDGSREFHGLPAPSFPCEFHADFSGISDRGLTLWALWQAQNLGALAKPERSREALFLVLGAAKLLAADPPIRLPLIATMVRVLGERGADRSGLGQGRHCLLAALALGR